MIALQAVADGHRHRLAAAMELIETCQEMGERVDPQTAIDVLAAVQAELEQQTELLAKRGIIPPNASYEDLRDAHAVIAATRILWDLVGTMQLRKQPSRMMRLVLKARNILYQDVLQPLLLTMHPAQRPQALKDATEWFYTLWSPQHLAFLHLVLESTISGKPPKKEIKEAARYLSAQFVGTQELDRLRKQNQQAAAEGTS